MGKEKRKRIPIIAFKSVKIRLRASMAELRNMARAGRSIVRISLCTITSTSFSTKKISNNLIKNKKKIRVSNDSTYNLKNENI